MKRTTAREIAVQLSFYACTSEKDVDELLNEFFNKEYYDTLAAVSYTHLTLPTTATV